MAEDKSKMPIVKSIAVKSDTGIMEIKSNIGSTFENTIDERVGGGGTSYTLAQFFDNYMKFMDENSFVYTGTTTPTNKKVKIWIDTSITNQDNYK